MAPPSPWCAGFANAHIWLVSCDIMINNVKNTVSTIAKRLLLALIRTYQLTLSRMLPPVCRFYPSCSQYAHEAVARYGVRQGSWMAAKRLCRCHPFNPGGYDPVE